jgi:hypothetical protein
MRPVLRDFVEMFVVPCTVSVPMRGFYAQIGRKKDLLWRVALNKLSGARFGGEYS